MKLVRYFPVAVDSIIANRMRASLTMLGIIIGVAAVLIMLGFGRGASANILGEVASQGTTRLTVSPGTASDGDGAGSPVQTLTMGDVKTLSNPAFHADVMQVVPQYGGNIQLVAGSNNTRIRVTGTTAAYADVHRLELAEGRFLTEDEITQMSNLIVIGPTVATDLFERRQVVGESVRIDGEPFTVSVCWKKAATLVSVAMTTVGSSQLAWLTGASSMSPAIGANMLLHRYPPTR